MKKRSLSSLALKKTTISNFLVGGMVDSDNACPSAVTCESNCFCIIPSFVCQIAGPILPPNCETPANESPANESPANAGNYANAAG